MCLGNQHNVDSEEQALQTIQQSQTDKQQTMAGGDEGRQLNIEWQQDELSEGGSTRQGEEIAGTCRGTLNYGTSGLVKHL